MKRVRTNRRKDEGDWIGGVDERKWWCISYHNKEEGSDEDG